LKFIYGEWGSKEEVVAHESMEGKRGLLYGHKIHAANRRFEV